MDALSTYETIPGTDGGETPAGMAFASFNSARPAAASPGSDSAVAFAAGGASPNPSPGGMRRQATLVELPFGANGTIEKVLYLVGNIVFCLGTLYWEHPKEVSETIPTVQQQEVLIWAIAMFVVGSVAFAFAAFFNALSLTQTHRTFTKWAVVTCSVYEMGAVLFSIGSVCFMPTMGCGKGMEVLGAWLFIIGSLMYVIGGVIEVVKTIALLFLKQKQEEALKKIQGAARHFLTQRRIATANTDEEMLEMLRKSDRRRPFNFEVEDGEAAATRLSTTGGHLAVPTKGGGAAATRPDAPMSRGNTAPAALDGRDPWDFSEGAGGEHISLLPTFRQAVGEPGFLRQLRSPAGSVEDVEDQQSSSTPATFQQLSCMGPTM